jgi:uncharacterized repeat protein (TIGR03803 family)
MERGAKQMQSLGLGSYALSSCIAAAMLAGCGGSQPPIGAPGAVPQVVGNAKSYHVVYNFGALAAAQDGAGPVAGLIDVDGVLYGTTAYGGTSNYGTVFSLSTTGSEHVLHSFGGGSDREHPSAGLIDVNGTLYGTTEWGGSGSNCQTSAGFSGCGTVYSISTTGTEHVLHSFGGGSDGVNPRAGLIDVKGTLYGTTYNGGTSGLGTVYNVSTSGTEKVLHSFSGRPDGVRAPREA